MTLKSTQAPAHKRIWSPDARVQRQTTKKISKQGKSDCEELTVEMSAYKNMRSKNEKNMKNMIEQNLSGLAEMLACKRDLQNFLKFYREELTKHAVNMDKQAKIKASLEGQIYNEQKKEQNLMKQIQELMNDIKVVRNHHFNEVKPVYDSQIAELASRKGEVKSSVSNLQTETAEMRKKNAQKS